MNQLHNKGVANGNKVKLFISYSRQDKSGADNLVAALEANNFEVMIDRRDLPYGEQWQGELADFIRASDTVIWLVSPDSISSKWCNWELGEVQRLNKRLVPIRVRAIAPEDLPETLGRLHLLPAEGIYEPSPHLATLIATLNTDRAWIKEATRLADRARQWMARGRDSGLLLRGRALQDAETWSRQRPPAAPAPSREILDLILAGRQSATRRGQYWFAGTVALLVASSAGGLWAWQQKLEADRRREEATAQRSVAERNYAFSIDATEQLAIGLARDLRDATGMRMDRVRGILDRAEKLYASLTNSSGETVRLMRSRIGLMNELALTYRRLGDASASRKRADEAVALTRKLPSLGLPAEETDLILAEVLMTLVDVAEIQGDRATTRMALDEAVASARRQAAQVSGKQRLMEALRNNGLSLARSDSVAARASFLEQAQIAQQISLAAPEDPAALRVFADALADIAWLEWVTNNLPSARQTYEGVATVLRQALNRWPENAFMNHSLLRALQRIADIAEQLGDKRVAIGATQEGLQIARNLAAARPDHYQSRVDISYALIRLALLKIDTGETDGAAGNIDEVLRLVRNETAQDPSDAATAERLSTMLIWAAKGLVRIGNQSSATEAAWQSIEILRKLAAASPDEVRIQESLAGSLGAAVEFLPCERGAGALREGINIYKRLLATGHNASHVGASIDAYGKRLRELPCVAADGDQKPIEK